MEDGPFYDAVRANHENVIKQEFVTYFKNKRAILKNP